MDGQSAGPAGSAGAAQTQDKDDVPTRGVHHLALTTEDMKATVEFYTGVLGMKLVHAMKVPEGIGTVNNRGNPPWERLRHYFFDMGGDSLYAFFEIPRGERPQTDRDAIGGMQHVAFACTAERFQDIQDRLKANGVPADGPIEILPGIWSVYFHDNNDIRLEACCKLDEGDAQGVVGSVTQTKAEATEELLTLGDNDWIDKVAPNLKS